MALVLRQPDFTTASRIAEAVNERFTDGAQVVHAGRIQVDIPPAFGGVSEAMAMLEGVRVSVEAPARFVINERTGTIVAGGNVRISEVMITYGSLIVLDPEHARHRPAQPARPGPDGRRQPANCRVSKKSRRGASSCSPTPT